MKLMKSSVAKGGSVDGFVGNCVCLCVCGGGIQVQVPLEMYDKDDIDQGMSSDDSMWGKQPVTLMEQCARPQTLQGCQG